MATSSTARLLPFLALLPLAYSSLSAAVVVTSGAQPTENVKIQQFVHTNDSSIGWRDNTVDITREVGQSFLTGEAFSLAAITVYLNISASTAVQNSAFTINLYQVTTSTSIGAPGNPASGTLISSQQGVFSGNFSVTGNTATSFLTFSLDAPVALAASSSYVFMLSFDTKRSGQTLALGTQNNSYANGLGWGSTNGVVFEPLNGSVADLTFSLQAVPEPGTVILAGLGLGLLLCRRRGSR